MSVDHDRRSPPTGAVSRPSLIGCVPLLLLLSLPAPGLRAADDDLLARAWQVDDPRLATAVFTRRMVAGPEPTRSELLWVMRFLLREDVADRCREALALSDRTEAICAGLLRLPGGRHPAASILARDAVMRYRHAQRRLATVQTADAEDDPAVMAAVTVGHPPPEGPGPGRRRAELLRALLDDTDRGTLELAAIAAAFYAEDDPELLEAVDGLQQREGAIPGARLLYRARLGLPVTAGGLREALGEMAHESRPVVEVSADLLRRDVRLPSACLAAEAAGILGTGEVVPALRALLAHADLRVRIDAARALGRIGSAAAAPDLLACLLEGPWPLAIHAGEALAACPAPGILDELIPALAGLRGRRLQQAIHVASCLAGHQYGRTDAAKWARWWEQAHAAYELDPEAASAFRRGHAVRDLSVDSPAAFYGLPIVSGRLVFVVDISGSMEGERMSSLRAATLDALRALPDPARFVLIPYERSFIRYGSLARPPNQEQATGFISRLRAGGGTDLFEPTVAALAVPGVDSIYLLTDGEPEDGALRDWYRITVALTARCHYLPVAINTVSFEAGDRIAAELANLARLNRGRHENL